MIIILGSFICRQLYYFYSWAMVIFLIEFEVCDLNVMDYFIMHKTLKEKKNKHFKIQALQNNICDIKNSAKQNINNNNNIKKMSISGFFSA